MVVNITVKLLLKNIIENTHYLMFFVGFKRLFFKKKSCNKIIILKNLKNYSISQIKMLFT